MSVLCLYSKVSTKVNARSHILHLTVFRNQFGYRFKYRPIIRVDVQDLVCKDSAATALYVREENAIWCGWGCIEGYSPTFSFLSELQVAVWARF